MKTWHIIAIVIIFVAAIAIMRIEPKNTYEEKIINKTFEVKNLGNAVDKDSEYWVISYVADSQGNIETIRNYEAYTLDDASANTIKRVNILDGEKTYLVFEKEITEMHSWWFFGTRPTITYEYTLYWGKDMKAQRLTNKCRQGKSTVTSSIENVYP
jgi:hypothetical protein